MFFKTGSSPKAAFVCVVGLAGGRVDERFVQFNADQRPGAAAEKRPVVTFSRRHGGDGRPGVVRTGRHSAHSRQSGLLARHRPSSGPDHQCPEGTISLSKADSGNPDAEINSFDHFLRTGLSPVCVVLAMLSSARLAPETGSSDGCGRLPKESVRPAYLDAGLALHVGKRLVSSVLGGMASSIPVSAKIVSPTDRRARSASSGGVGPSDHAGRCKREPSISPPSPLQT